MICKDYTLLRRAKLEEETGEDDLRRGGREEEEDEGARMCGGRGGRFERLEELVHELHAELHAELWRRETVSV